MLNTSKIHMGEGLYLLTNCSQIEVDLSRVLNFSVNVIIDSEIAKTLGCWPEDVGLLAIVFGD